MLLLRTHTSSQLEGPGLSTGQTGAKHFRHSASRPTGKLSCRVLAPTLRHERLTAVARKSFITFRLHVQGKQSNMRVTRYCRQRFGSVNEELFHHWTRTSQPLSSQACPLKRALELQEQALGTYCNPPSRWAFALCCRFTCLIRA